MTRKKHFILILILGSLTALSPFSIDMYLPGFRSIASHLHTTIAHIQLSLTTYFIGISIGQLIYGPLLDRFGRKKPLYAGLAIYIAASLGCALSKSADNLIFMRLLQALGSCAGMVAARAIVRDLFPVTESAKVFSLLMLVVAVSPMIAPTVGGYVSAAWGWEYVFIILTGIAVLILIASIIWLDESKEPDTGLSLKPGPILTGFYNVVIHPQFYIYTLTGGIAAAGLYAYISGSPDVFMTVFKTTEKQYGWIFALISVGLISASQINSLLLRRFKSERIIVIALLCQVFTGAALVSLASMRMLNLWSTIALIFTFVSCQGFTFPNSSALALAPFGKTAGSASALLGFFQMGVGALTTAVVSLLNDHTALPMAGVMAACSVTAFLIVTIGGTLVKRDIHARRQVVEAI
jgi:DHA1 family bicyclomycin/chloramphenicol resistance-like MFS transporter